MGDILPKDARNDPSHHCHRHQAGNLISRREPRPTMEKFEGEGDTVVHLRGEMHTVPDSTRPRNRLMQADAPKRDHVFSMRRVSRLFCLWIHSHDWTCAIN